MDPVTAANFNLFSHTGLTNDQVFDNFTADRHHRTLWQQQIYAS
jgi:hypothetical protein